MTILDILSEYGSSILFVLIFAAIVVLLIYKKQYAILDKIVFSLVTEAEKKYGGGTGAAKLAAVVEWVYPKIPAVVRFFITSDELMELIENILTEAKKKWDSNPKLSAYITSTESK
jgi:hypothetical protein